MADHKGHPCLQVTNARRRCHDAHGILDEDCVREELLEKRCYAGLLCKRQAERFYRVPLDGGRGGGGATCSTLAEAFAFPEHGMLLPERTEPDRRAACRRIGLDLARCLATRLKPRPSVERMPPTEKYPGGAAGGRVKVAPGGPAV